MVEAGLESEVREILKCIEEKQNFLLSGGAGSGKTYCLVQVIQQVLKKRPTAKVACMTYTNAAAKEIEGRINHKNLTVSTIHDFLWSNVKHFQKELKSVLVSLVNNREISKISMEEIIPISSDYFDSLEQGVQYREYASIKRGIISHDELLIIAEHLFERYPKLSDIVKDTYQLILIDEYQDTSRSVVEIFLVHFKKSKKQNVVGFFGDAMQSIYDDSIGNLDDYKGVNEGQVREVRRAKNRRNPEAIIKLANRIRTDGLVQEPSKDKNAPNMVNGRIKKGIILFLHSTNATVEQVQDFLRERYAWDFTDFEETKELNLTHNLIADKAGFKDLMTIYDGDLILDYRDRIKKYIRNNSITDDFSDKTFGEVIQALRQDCPLDKTNLLEPTASMQRFIVDNTELYDVALKTNYLDFSKLYVEKDQLIGTRKQDRSGKGARISRNDHLVQHLYKIQKNIVLYENRRYNEFLRVTDCGSKIKSIEDKKKLKKDIESLIHVGEKTIEEVVDDAHIKGVCCIGDELNEFKVKSKYLYDRVKNVKFEKFRSYTSIRKVRLLFQPNTRQKV